MKSNQTRRHVMFVLAGAAVLMLKPYYHGPLSTVFHDYGGNFAVSFAVYFLAALAAYRLGRRRWLAAVLALLAVELFEVLNGFGIMANVYDPIDLLANAAGIGLAFALDPLTWPHQG